MRGRDAKKKRDLRVVGGGVDGVRILAKGPLRVQRLLVVVKEFCRGFHRMQVARNQYRRMCEWQTHTAFLSSPVCSRSVRCW